MLSRVQVVSEPVQPSAEAMFSRQVRGLARAQVLPLRAVSFSVSVSRQLESPWQLVSLPASRWPPRVASE